jgi:hypothetical protein
MQKEAMLAAIEKALHEGLGNGSGDWIAVAAGEEIEFRIDEKGEIEVLLSDETEEETTHRFQVLVREIS